MKKQTYITMIISFIWLGMALPTSAQTTQQLLLTRINNLRADVGLAPYSLNSALNAAALNHAQWMVSTSQVTHIQDNGSIPRTRAQANGYNSQWVSENIYMGGLASVDTAWAFWINSSIHYAGLTSTNYRDIGIATARGTGGQAYVLVFGVPPTASVINTANRSNTNTSTNASAPPAPPSAIVGYDAVGNIEYQLQAGDTLGQVLLLFGYTWDDLNTMLDLNAFTEADIRNLAVGQVVLVPPPQGTYTPTPFAEVTEPPNTPLEPTREAQASPSTQPNAQTDGIIPTPLPDDASAQATPILPTATPLASLEAVEAVGEAVTFVGNASSPTPTATHTPIPTLQVIGVQATAITPSPTDTPILIEDATPPSTPQAPPLWLIGAIVLQLGIFGYATFEGLRRLRQ